jgi:pimeloyl-ACP methyl ester carboxylesterase
LIPLIIEQAHTRENYTPIAANAIRIITSLKSALKIGMHNAVVCAEDVPYLGTVDYAELEATYMGTEQTRTLETLCRRWPRGIVDEDLHTMLDLTIPTLILSGEEDPITPPKYGEAVAASLKNSLHLVGPGQGHGIFNRGCVPGLMTRFVENGDWRELSTTCISRLRHQPFFLNSMGPQP